MGKAASKNIKTYSELHFNDGNSVLGDRGRWPKQPLRASLDEGDPNNFNDPDNPGFPKPPVNNEPFYPMVSEVHLIDTTSILLAGTSSTSSEEEAKPGKPKKPPHLRAQRSKSAPVIATSSISSEELDVNLNAVQKPIRKSKRHHQKPETKIIVQEMITEADSKPPRDPNSVPKNVSKKPLPPAVRSRNKTPKSEPRINNSPPVKPGWSSNSNLSRDGRNSTGSSRKKLVVRGLKSFVSTRSSCPPAWVKDFPCKSRFHPDNYIYDWEQGNGAKIPPRGIGAGAMGSGGIGPAGAMGPGPKRSARCGTCGIYSDDACRCCRKCPLDCPCPKPPSKIPDVMSQAFGPGWTQAQKVICEMTDSDRRHPVGGNAAKMNRGLAHLQCNIDIMNPSRSSSYADECSGGQTQQSNQGHGSNYYQSPPMPYTYYPPPVQQPMYPSYYPAPMSMPSYIPMQNSLPYPQPSYQNFSMSPYPPEYPQNY